MISGIEDTKPNQPKKSISDVAEFLGVSTQAVHKQLRNKGIVCEKIGNKSFITFDTAEKLFLILTDSVVS